MTVCECRLCERWQRRSLGRDQWKRRFKTLLAQADRQKRSFQRRSIVDVRLNEAALWLTPTRQHVLFHTAAMNMQDFYYSSGGTVSGADSSL